MPIVGALERYRFVAGAIDAGPMLAVARLASMTLVTCSQTLPEDLGAALDRCAGSRREDSELLRLSRIEELNKEFEKLELSTLTQEARVVRDIIHLVWMSLFERYYRLTNENQRKGEQSAGDN